MTEQEWLVCEDPRAMYAGVPYPKVASVNDRRWRLLACAIQTAWLPFVGPDFDIDQTKQAIETATKWAETGNRDLHWSSSAYFVLNSSACNGVYWLVNEPRSVSPETVTRNAEMDRKSADLFREVIGNPYRRQKWSTCEYCYGEGWRTKVDHDNPGSSIKKLCRKCDPKGDILSIAQQIYDTQDYAGMPILADAMEEAGCDVQSILEHLRGGNTHVRGCWALDLLLGKE